MLGPLATILVAMAVAAPALALDEPRAGSQSAIRTRCDALFKEVSEAQKKYIKDTHGAKNDEEARKFSPPDLKKYATQFLAMAREHPDDPAAVDALIHSIVLDVDPFGPRWTEAIDRLSAKHIRSPEIGQVLYLLSQFCWVPTIEPLLGAVLKDNPDAEARGKAALALANHLRRGADEAIHLRTDPEAFRRGASGGGLEIATRLRDRDAEAMRREADSLLELVVEQYARFTFFDRSTLGEKAQAMLRETRELAVGKLAPEIEGRDIEGKPMKLSDFRGKVVVLVFWATWCGPCMQMVPHERELVRRLEGKPFVLIGINGDEDAGRLKHQMKENQINWRSWADGGPSGPISSRWNVTGWPMVFVLDPEGVIRYQGHRDEGKLDEAVEKELRGKMNRRKLSQATGREITGQEE